MKDLPEIELPHGSCAIADLHLDPRVETPWRAFTRWLSGLERVPVLIVLGDLFEYWTGPAQARAPAYAALLSALHDRARSGTALHFLHGNRDFLLDPGFERAVQGRVHPAGLVGRTPDGTRVLFLHGDELATSDRSYQNLRRVLRSGPTRWLVRALPGAWREACARGLRGRSRQAVAAKPDAYKELQAAEAARRSEHHRATLLVCGHAHLFRDERLPRGGRWIVLDAFGGERDLLRVGPAGSPEAGGSHSAC